MLHGSPSSPEYVLNSEQAGTLLKNLATMTMSPYQAPQVDSYNNGGNSTVYQFTGDMNLPNVQRPDQFFDELLHPAFLWDLVFLSFIRYARNSPSARLP